MADEEKGGLSPHEAASEALSQLTANLGDSDVEPHRITCQRASDDLWVYRIYAANDKDYDGGTISVAIGD